MCDLCGIVHYMRRYYTNLKGVTFQLCPDCDADIWYTTALYTWEY